MTVSSVVFAEGGYDTESFKLFRTDSSFMTNEVFGLWITDVFLPEVERRRAFLHEKIGDFDDRAVVILDGCRCHTTQDVQDALAANRITMRLLPAYTSH